MACAILLVLARVAGFGAEKADADAIAEAQRVTMSSVIPETAVRSRVESRKRYGKLLEPLRERGRARSPLD